MKVGYELGKICCTLETLEPEERKRKCKWIDKKVREPSVAIEVYKEMIMNCIKCEHSIVIFL